MTHIHLHAKSQKRFGDAKVDLVQKRMSRYALDALIDNLESAVRALRWTPRDTLWADYYEDTNYTPAAFEHKEKIVAEMLDISRPGMVVDLGANTGKFSRMASGRGIFTLAVDSDPSAVERNYRQVREKGERNMLPLLLDITNPSPAIGWENAERSSWMSRASADTVLALALIHHLAISHNLPLCRLADFFRKMGKFLVVEFIPKNDSQVVRLLRNREDIFGGYTQENFEKEFQKYFSIMRKRPLAESGRCLYLMKGNA
jgi:ribosomal protein L11 methylase PrmA